MSAAPPVQPSRRLRWAVFALAVAQTLYWGYAMSFAIRELNNPNADGFGMIPAFFATPPFLVLTLPALIIAIVGRGLRTGLVLAVVGALLTPLVPWQMLLASELDAFFWTPPA